MPSDNYTRIVAAFGAACGLAVLVAVPALGASVPSTSPSAPDAVGVVAGLPDPGGKAREPQSDLANYPKLARPLTGPAVSSASTAEEQVVATTTIGNLVEVTVYDVAEGFTPAQLVDKLRRTGVDARVAPAVPPVSGVHAAGANDCALGLANAINFNHPTEAIRCPNPAHWTNNGYADPQVRFNDHTSAAWPVSKAVYSWNQTPGIDSSYLYNSCPFKAGARCIDVFSDDYGDSGWNGLTSFRLATDRSGRFIESATRVQLNDHYAPNSAQRRRTACHELGHALGLGHTQSLASCMHAPSGRSSIDTGGTDDFAYLANVYSVTR